MVNYQNSALLDALKMTAKVDESKAFKDSFQSLAVQIDRHNCGYECTMHGESMTYNSSHLKTQEFQKERENQNFESRISSISDLINPLLKKFSLGTKIDKWNHDVKNENQPRIYGKNEETAPISQTGKSEKIYSKHKENDWYAKGLTFSEQFFVDYSKHEKNDWYAKEVPRIYEKEERKRESHSQEVEVKKEEAKKEPTKSEENENDKRSGSEKRSEEPQSRQLDDYRTKKDSSRDRRDDESKQPVLSVASSASAGVLQPDNAKSERHNRRSDKQRNKRRAK